jgi:K+-transporting ATPase c subunit
LARPRPPSTDANDATKTIPTPYNGGNSSGSNLGWTSKALIDRIAEDAKTLQAENPGSAISVALVTTSASGLDSDLTPHGVYDRHGDATCLLQVFVIALCNAGRRRFGDV